MDILLIIDGSDVRRKFVDGIISQYDSSYLNNLLAYNKALNHRNLLLKSFWLNRNFEQESLDVWDDQLVQYGNLIYNSRKKFIDDFVYSNTKSVPKNITDSILFVSDNFEILKS